MSAIAIRVEDLGKQYRVTAARHRPNTLRDAVAGSVRDAARRLAARLRGNGERGPGGRETFWALRGVSFEAGRGDVLGIVGGNGAGKSTLLKILARITEPTTGRAEVHGRVGSLLEVGTGFHSELTGRENVFLSGAILGMRRTEIARKFDEIVAFAEVERFIDMPVKHYSNGMGLRLAFAVAAHLEPEILIIDEVLAVGDARFQRKCLGKMQDVSTREGRTVLFVSHNMNAVRRLCSRCLLLREGELAAAGPTAEVMARHLAATAGIEPSLWIDLAGIQRSGSGEARFRALSYDSGSAAAAGQPYPGGPLAIDLEIEATESRSVSGLAVTLYDRSGAKLVNADILSLGRVVTLRPGRNRVRLRIEALQLNPGIYPLGLWLADHGGTVLDFSDAALDLEVVDLEREGLGARPAADGVVPCRFTLEVEEP
ncbi:MAG TPA: polysaccharide ABC transporter ATP-binding protein [Thermoanaerobaculia bacterium]|nr:polysaccharide ABC transporter ATP-binding protein [Thermoanaerobaculia bacterium]